MISTVPDLKLTGARVLQTLSLPQVRVRLGIEISREATAIPLSARRDTYQVQDASGQYIVRFAADARHLAVLHKEERVRRGLQERVDIEIPDTQVLELANGQLTPWRVWFAIHRMIPGSPLETECYTRAVPEAQGRLVRDLARFFWQAHDVPLKLACDWLGIAHDGTDIAAALAPEYGKPVWFGPRAIADMRPQLSSIIDRRMETLFEDTVIRFLRLETCPDYMVFGHGDMHGYNIAVRQDDLGPKLVGVFDLENAGIMDVHEDFFRLSLVSEPMLERVLAAYQELVSGRALDRNRIAIYYRAFLFHLMVGKTGERLEHLKRLLFRHAQYHDATHPCQEAALRQVDPAPSQDRLHQAE
jgi:aminoglycoside phosphotransferase (APT) family kinase protein